MLRVYFVADLAGAALVEGLQFLRAQDLDHILAHEHAFVPDPLLELLTPAVSEHLLVLSDLLPREPVLEQVELGCNSSHAPGVLTVSRLIR
jgi:hypothetical protein